MTKSIIYSAIAVTFMLLMTEFGSFNLFAHKNITLHYECTDFSKHSEHSSVNYVEDEILNIASKTKSYKSENVTDYPLIANLNPRKSFYSEIWEPPKYS